MCYVTEMTAVNWLRKIKCEKPGNVALCVRDRACDAACDRIINLNIINMQEMSRSFIRYTVDDSSNDD